MARKEGRVDFFSKDFSAADALTNPNINLQTEDVIAEDSLETVRDKLHSEDLSSLPKDAEVGEHRRMSMGNGTFTFLNSPIPARVKPVRNVLTRMAAAEGPLQMLLTAKTNSSIVKVYIRNDRGVRSVMTGTLLAFDKHFNLVLRDVSEVFCARRRYKRHAIDGKDGDFVTVADMSIKDTDDDEKRAIEQLNRKKIEAQSKTEFSPLQEFLTAVKDRPVTSQVMPPEVVNPDQTLRASGSGEYLISEAHLPGSSGLGKFAISAPSTSSMVTRKGRGFGSQPQDASHGLLESCLRSEALISKTKTSRASDLFSSSVEASDRLHFQSNPAEIKHSVRGNELENKITSGDQSREAAMLKLARKARQSYNPEDYNYRYDSRAKTKGFDPIGENERDILEKASDSNASVSSESDRHSATRLSPAAAAAGGDSHVKRGRRKRVKKRREIRKRFVKQLLIRGENVVLVCTVDS